MKIFYELYKNFKVIFRSWTSISSLILGPLILILLIGYAFSGDSLHSIKIGVIADDYKSIQPILENISSYSTIIKYNTANNCIKDLKIENVHICLEFEDSLTTEEEDENIPSSKIMFYYDNTRGRTTSALVNKIQDFLGVTSEQISLQATSSIFDNIQQLVLFLKEKSLDINDLQNQSQQMKSDLIARKDKLIQIREQFIPKYESIKDIQSEINSKTQNMSEDTDKTLELIQEIKLLTTEINNYNDKIIKLLDTPASIYITSSEAKFDVPIIGEYQIYNISQIEIINISGTTLNIDYPDYELFETSTTTADITNLSSNQVLGIFLTILNNKLLNLDQNLDILSSNIETTDNQFQSLKSEFNSIITQIDDIKNLLDQEIQSTEEYIIKIDAANKKITSIKEKLGEGLGKLEFINPELAEKIVKPILKTYEPVKSDINNIQLTYPLLLSVVIIFISMLFSNIVTLSEINSKAFFRNLIAPVKDFNYTLGLIITNFIVIFFQVFILILVGQYKFDINIFSNIWPILIVVSLLSLIFIFMGMTFAYLFKNQQTSILTTTFVSLGFFLFSDVVTSLEMMPKIASIIAAFNPIVITTKMFKEIIIFNNPLNIMTKETVTLIIYATVMFLILLYAANKSKKRR